MGMRGMQIQQSLTPLLYLAEEQNPQRKRFRYLLGSLLCNTNIQQEREDALLDYLKTQHNVINNRSVTGLLTLITAMPEYQLS